MVSDIVLERAAARRRSPPTSSPTSAASPAREQKSRYFAGLADAGLGEIEILRDVDYLETMLATVPDEVAALLARTGTTLAEVREASAR